MFCKKGVLKHFTKFIGKHLCQNLFFIKVTGWPLKLYKKGTLARVLSCEFCQIFKSTVFQRKPLVAALNYKYSILKSHRSSRPEVLWEKGVLESFTGKHLCRASFQKKLQVQAFLERPFWSHIQQPVSFNNLVCIICQQNLLQKQNISYIFFTCNKFP